MHTANDRMSHAQTSILSCLEKMPTKSRSCLVCCLLIYIDLEMPSIDAATTLGLDALDELARDGLVVLYARDDGLGMARLP